MQDTRPKHTMHRHLESFVFYLRSCAFGLNGVRDPSVSEFGGGRLDRRSSICRRSAFSHLERSVTRISSSACNRKTVFACHRDAAGSARDCQATCGTPPKQQLTVAESAHRPCTAKAVRKHARTNEASLLLTKHTKEAPLARSRDVDFV